MQLSHIVHSRHADNQEFEPCSMGMARIRILHIIGQLGVGGTERQLLGLLSRMDQARFDSTVCYYWRMPDGLEDDFRKAGIRVVFVDKPGQRLWRFFRDLRRVVSETSPDIVHTWLPSAGFWGRWAGITCGVRHIIASDRGEIVSERLIDRASERLLARRTVRLANSLTVARTLERAFRLPLERTRIIYNAVDMPRVDRLAARREVRTELGLDPRCRLVLTVGRLTPEKNYPMLVRTAAAVCRQRNDVRFLVAGYGSQLDEVAALVSQAGLDDRLRLLGLRRDVERLLAAADVFCFTSNSEGFPNAVLEAMASGLPVICTSFPSSEEVLSRPGTGVLVPRDDHQAMAREICALLDDGERRMRLWATGRESVLEKFTWGAVVRTMEALYTETALRIPGSVS